MDFTPAAIGRPAAPWRWTATHDKGMIFHVRANPVYHSNFWHEASNASGRGSKWQSAKERWRALRKMGVPLPAIVYPRQSRPRKWAPETVDAVLARLEHATEAQVAREYGVTHGAIHTLRQRYRVRRTPMQTHRRSVSKQEQADIAFAEKAWAAFEKSQSANGVN